MSVRERYREVNLDETTFCIIIFDLFQEWLCVKISLAVESSAVLEIYSNVLLDLTKVEINMIHIC